MLGLADIRDWLKQLDTKTVAEIDNMTVQQVNDLELRELLEDGYAMADNFYIGKLDNKKDKSIGIYSLERSNPPGIALGGLSNTKTMEKPVSILIHWNTNYKETELKALELYYKLLNLRELELNNVKVNYVKLLVSEPIDVGTDSKNVYERVIQAIFYYENREV